MSSILSACLVLYHCGDELTHALRCIQNADIEVDVYLVDNSPEEPTAEKMQWLFPGITVLPQKGNIGFGRANNAVLPLLHSKYHLIMNPDVTFDPGLLGSLQNGRAGRDGNLDIINRKVDHLFHFFFLLARITLWRWRRSGTSPCKRRT